jgi:succinate dehydrogenase / fumarate reductase, cytochrome b subunit
MALSLTKENYFWHKLHSLTGIIPVGFYMVQHLTLNSFSVAGPDKFNGVIGFFDSLPPHILLGIEIFLLWIPILFHAVYGLLIVNRGEPNYFSTRYGWSQNRMYTLQRYTGIFIFLFLIVHVVTTTGAKYYSGSSEVLYFASWHDRLTSYGYVWLLVYMLGVAASSYHLAYGVWNFCIRWGITISDKAQMRIQKFALWMFIGVTVLGWSALGGFLFNGGRNVQAVDTPGVHTSSPSADSDALRS